MKMDDLGGKTPLFLDTPENQGPVEDNGHLQQPSDLEKRKAGFFFPGMWIDVSGTGAELGGSNSHIFMFIPILPGEMIQFDYSNIFQMGWFKHQPENNADSTETTREMNSDVSDRDLIHEC